jgi:hypothetical protein
MKCKESGCASRVLARGMCAAHYYQARRRGFAAEAAIDVAPQELDDVDIRLSPYALAAVMDSAVRVTRRQVSDRLVRFQIEKNAVIDAVYSGMDPDHIERLLCRLVNGLLDDLAPGWKDSVSLTPAVNDGALPAPPQESSR